MTLPENTATSMRQALWDDADVRADLAAVRAAAPLVHCLTNIVVTGITANTLLAIGAAPAMVTAEEEAGPFASIAGALLVNVGTIVAADEAPMRAAVAAAGAAGKPWVLDPVAVGVLPLRTRVARELMAQQPAIIRGNASEIMGLGGAGAGGRGVDATDAAEAALEAARDLAQRTGAVVAISGVVDYVTDGTRTVAVPGGHVLMTRVTGIGCALGAVLAAFAAVQPDRLRAAVSASCVYGEAGARAGRRGGGPGSFAVAFLDELAAIGLG